MAMMRKTREDVYDGAEPVGLTAPEDLDESYQPPVRDAPISAAIDVRRDKFPYAIVWTPIPCITWLLPFVGHMGIADSAGAIHDFAGPYYIGYDDMAFGRPTRYLILDPKKITAPSKGSPTQAWNAGVEHGNSVYVKRMHNLICDNCHSHVACCLNSMQYNGSTNWNMVKLAAWMFFAGRFVSVGRTIATFLPFALILAFILTMRFVLG